MIENKLRQNPKTIIIDEVDYLVNNNVIEILRDLHDRSGCPMVLVGMSNIDKKLSKYPHLKDRIYKAYKFESYDSQDIKQIISELSEIPITPDGLEYLATRHNQFRQIVKLINKIEKMAKTNEIKELNEEILRSILGERQNITALQTARQIYA
jgi:DNA transposition AAA+ family ATPase